VEHDEDVMAMSFVLSFFSFKIFFVVVRLMLLLQVDAGEVSVFFLLPEHRQ
jgi:hypothetical protein